jgi:hypothetical protein
MPVNLPLTLSPSAADRNIQVEGRSASENTLLPMIHRNFGSISDDLPFPFDHTMTYDQKVTDVLKIGAAVRTGQSQIGESEWTSQRR